MSNNLPYLYSEDPSFVMPRKFLPEDRYAEAMEALIVVCADAIFINRERKSVFLAWRRAKPLPGWWFIGGRINAGEREIDGIVRLVSRETTLVFLPERFSFLRMNRYICSEREQEPQQAGSDTLSYMFAIELTHVEYSSVAVNLEQNEYDRERGLREFKRSDLIEEGVHPAILDIYDQLFGLPIS